VGVKEPTGWIELAARWGHQYVVMGPYKDNYPVVITSKYPLELVERLRGDENNVVSHGAVHVKVHFTDDISVNLVNLHLQPDNIANASAYRMNEINYYLSKTINSKEHYRDEHWLMMGDFNSNVGKNVDLEVRKNSYYDLWAEMNSYNKSYIDFIYGTESMRKSLKSIDFLYGFAHTEKIMYSPNGVAINNGVGVWKYSDHYPVLAEFSLYE
jgi:endonuclease/exonuclease/phosphatase family metal-dependent hydrolase